jgi:hypothetical protein
LNRRTENERKISVTGLDGFSDYAIQTICLIKKVSCVWEWLDLARAMMDFPGPDLIKAIIDLNPWNIPPKPDANGPYFANEGQEIIFNASGSIDEDDDELEYRWDFDSNGTVDTAWSSNPIASNTWHDDFKGNATLYVRDLNTPQTPWNYTAMANVTVNNVAPSVEAGENQVVNEADTVYFNGDFSDIGDDTHTIEWNLDDGSTFSGTLTPTHVYVDNGVYTVTLTEWEQTRSQSL